MKNIRFLSLIMLIFTLITIAIADEQYNVGLKLASGIKYAYFKIDYLKNNSLENLTGLKTINMESGQRLCVIKGKILITIQELGWIDLAGISPDDVDRGDENTLNGIAYDEATDRIFVTGKNWKKLFEIKLKVK